METTTETQTTTLLTQFVNQRPGLDFANYGDVKPYRAEMREITADRNDFFELYALASNRLGTDFNELLTSALESSSGRLTLKDGVLEYTTGQYFPTEYRPAACRVLANLIWADYANEKNTDESPVYADGHEIRKAIKRNVSRRVAKNYFN